MNINQKNGFLFKPIPGYTDYLISVDGIVFSTKTNNFLKAHKSNRGRWRVSLSKHGYCKHFQISRLVGVTYLGVDIDDKSVEIDHINCDLSQNNLKNLQSLSVEEHFKKTLLDKKHKKRTTCFCIKCGTEMKSILKSRCNGKHDLQCIKCLRKSYPLHNITLEQIDETLNDVGSWTKAAKIFGVSDNGLRKKYKRLKGNNQN